MNSLPASARNAQIDPTTTARVPDGIRVYVIGDVHGMAGLLADVHARIDADLAKHPVTCPVEVMLGDLVDRGPDSYKVLALLCARRSRTEVICLAGNHELYMVQALAHLDAFEEWMSVGGDETVRSFGVTPPPYAAAPEAFRAFSAAVPIAIKQFLAMLLPLHRIGDYLFVHAGLMPDVPLAQQVIMDLTLIRKPFLSYKESYGFVVVHGHTPVPEVEFHNNRINLDTGAYRTGKLSCVALERDTIRQI